MLSQKNKVFGNLYGNESVTLTTAMKRGDWMNVQEIIQKGPEFIIHEVIESGLRGRGGGGFLTGKKWSFIEKNSNCDSYLVINADESEPGSCKDRDILRNEPYKLLEGALYAARAIQAHTVYIYIRGEYFCEQKVLQKAIDELYAAGLLGASCTKTGWDLDIYIHKGAGAYICGEESALLESIEGRKGMPRLKPPFPAVIGLFGKPTIVNNVETIATISAILKRGAKWFSSLGTEQSRGTKIFSISGHVNNPCNIEEELGIPVKTLIETYAGGVVGGWGNLLAIIPGGTSMPMLPKSICETLTMDYETLQAHHSGLGTASIIVMNKSVDIVDAAVNIAKFYMHESCGQCTPCREGTGWMWRVLKRLSYGEGQKRDIDDLEQITSQIAGQTICAFGEAAAWPVQGLLRHFRHEIEQRIGS